MYVAVKEAAPLCIVSLWICTTRHEDLDVALGALFLIYSVMHVMCP